MVHYVKMIDNDGRKQFIQDDRVERFLELGWKIADNPSSEKKVTKSKSSKNKITAEAQVTSKETSVDEVVEEVEEDEDPDAMDTLTFSYDDFETAKKED